MGGAKTGGERMAPVPEAAWDEAQRRAAEAFAAARGRPVSGPFARMIRSPEAMSAARAMGDYLRYRPAVGTTLSELVILVTARAWSQDYEWSLHAPIAVERGVAPETVAAIADGRRPGAMGEDEAAAHDFAVELHRDRRVCDLTYARAVARFGEAGVVDLTALCGYYALLAMQLNVMRCPPRPGGPILPRLPGRGA
jgi:4-carboxymuconolactone decarboxylase